MDRMREKLGRRIIVYYLVAAGVALHVAVVAVAAMAWKKHGLSGAAKRALAAVQSTGLTGMAGDETSGRTPDDGIRFPDLSERVGQGASHDTSSPVPTEGDPGSAPAGLVVEVRTVAD